MKEMFRRFADTVSHATGTPWAFIGAVVIVAVWAAVGVITGFTDTHQLIINTGTTIITFWMGFIIQATQNRDNKAIHLKLDALIDASEAENRMIDLEHLSDDDLAAVEAEMQRRRREGLV